MNALDPKRIIAEVAARHGIKLDAKDPMMAVVTLNELALMKFMTPMVERIEAAGGQFEEAYIRTQRRAGKAISEEAREAVSVLRAEIQSDIEGARLNARELVLEVHQANKRGIMVRWVAVSLICALILFVLGFWTGRIL
jgi:hypothetical protein